MGRIVSIAYKPQDHAEPEDAYLRLPVEATTLIAGYGIEGDSKGGSAGRHLNIMDAASLRELEALGFDISPGAMGEQVVVDGIGLDALPAGTRIRMGDSAVVELVKPRTGCAKFERNQGLSPQRAASRMGMMADVTAGGPIRIGNSVEVVTP